MTWRRFPRFFELAWEDREAGRCRVFMAKNCEGWPFDSACAFEDEGGESQDPYMNLDHDDEFDLSPISQPHLQPGSAC